MGTPEGVVLEYSLAGVGSRFIAAATDLFIQLAIMGCVLFVLAFALAGVGAGEGFVIALIAITVFLGTYGYDTGFETLRNGQTPGKEILGIRVIRQEGVPVDFKAAAIRNIVYLFDGPLTLWTVGMVSILVTKKNQRLGDIAAGTIVVRERTGEDEKRAAPLPPGYERPAPPPEEEAAAPAAPIDFGGLKESDIAIVRQFLDRRRTLDPGARRALATQLAEKVDPLVAGVERGDDDEAFLETVANATSRG